MFVNTLERNLKFFCLLKQVNNSLKQIFFVINVKQKLKDNIAKNIYKKISKT